MSKATYQKQSNSAYNRAKRKKSFMLYLFGVLAIAGTYSCNYLSAVKSVPYSLAVCIVVPPCTFVLYLAYRIRSKIRRRYLGQGLNKIDKMTGEEFERFLYYHFEAAGYKALKIGQSNDYGADIILTKGRTKIAVQAKRYQSRVGIKAVQEVIGAVKYYHASKGMVVTNSRFSKQAEELAKEAGIELYDRDYVKELIKKQRHRL